MAFAYLTKRGACWRRSAASGRCWRARRRGKSMMRRTIAAAGVAALSLSARPPVRLPACDPGNAGLTLPDGFCAVVVAEQVGAARHVVVAANGDLFVALAGGRSSSGGVLALRDTTGDGKADVREAFGSEGGTGIALGKGVLYASTPSTVYRYALRAGSLTPLGAPDVLVKDLPTGGDRGHNRAPAPA